MQIRFRPKINRFDKGQISVPAKFAESKCCNCDCSPSSKWRRASANPTPLPPRTKNQSESIEPSIETLKRPETSASVRRYINPSFYALHSRIESSPTIFTYQPSQSKHLATPSPPLSTDIEFVHAHHQSNEKFQAPIRQSTPDHGRPIRRRTYGTIEHSDPVR